MPTYLPEGKTIDHVREELLASMKAAAPSYGVFRGPTMSGFVQQGEDYLNAVAPINNIPNAESRSVPQFLVRGTKDPLISDEEVATYTKALEDAGQRVEYIQVGGASHAFFDWKPDQRTKDTFEKYGVYYAQRMKEFFLSVLND